MTPDQHTPPVDTRVLTLATFTALHWRARNLALPEPERDAKMIQTAVLHLIEQGLLQVPADLDQRLNVDIPAQRINPDLFW